MTNHDHKKFSLQNCLNFEHQFEASGLSKRLIHMTPGEKPKAAPEPKEAIDVKTLVDIDKFENSTDFKPDMKETLKNLALKDKALAQNFEEALKESLQKAGYDLKAPANKEVDMEKFWKDMTDLKSQVIEVKNGNIHFYSDKEKTKEVAPKFSAIPIIVDLSRFRPEIDTSSVYFNKVTGKVELNDANETAKVTVSTLVKYARNGTEIKVTNNATPAITRTAVFKEDGKNAYYTDGKKERVAIFNGYKLELVNALASTAKETDSVWGSMKSAGDYEFGKGFSADDYITAGLKGKPAELSLVPNDQLTKLRLMASEGYTAEKYTAFLIEKKAIKKDKIYLLVDPSFETKAEKAEKAAAEKKEVEEAKKRKAETLDEAEKSRQRYLIPSNMMENSKFVLSDPKLIEALGNPDKWNKAWAQGNIEGMKVLRGIVESEPIFSIYLNDTDKIRTALLEAITRGYDKQIDFVDFINILLKNQRMPSFGADVDKNVTDIMSKQGKFSTWYEKLPPAQKEYDQIKKANGFLKKLGPDVMSSATCTKSEKDGVWVNFVFEKSAYTVRVDSGGALGTSFSNGTIQIYQFNSTTPYPSQTGYDNWFGYKVGTLAEGDFGPTNEVITKFRNAVTPPITASGIKKLFEQNFQPNGTPKGNFNASFTKKMQDIIIGGNRLMLQLRDMKYTETTSNEGSMIENRTAKISDDKYVDIIDNESAWNAEWQNPTHNITKLLKQAFTEDPILSEVMRGYPTEVASRLRTAVRNGYNSHQLDFGDVINEVMKGIRMPSMAPEAKELPQGQKFTDYFVAKDKKTDADNWAHLVLSSLGSESFNRAVVHSYSNDAMTVTTTFENRTYSLICRKGGAFTHMIEIRTPDGKPYADSNGYDKSEEFGGNMGESDKPKILAWFKDAVRPPLDGKGNFRSEYARLFDAQGNPKPGTTPEAAARYKAIIRASNRILMAFEGQGVSTKEVSEETSYSQYLHNQKLETIGANLDKVYNLDEVIKNSQGNEIFNVLPQPALSNSAGIQIFDNILAPAISNDFVVKNKLGLFKAVFQTYSLEELVREGCIKKGTNSKLPNQEFYLITKLPPTLLNYLQQRTKPGEVTNFEKVIANNFNLNTKEYKESINPQAKLQRIVETFFPNKKSARTGEDVSEAKVMGNDSMRNFYSRVDYSFANTQFLQDITTDGNKTGTIDRTKLITQLNRYLELFSNRLDLEYGPEKAPKIRAEFEKAVGPSLTINEANLDSILNDPKKMEQIIEAVRDGFVFSHDKKVEQQREDAINTLKTNTKKWMEKLTSEGDYQKLMDFLKTNTKIPPAEIPAAVEKILPIWLAAGYDGATGGFTVGGGVSFPIILGHNGEYGVLMVGGGAYVGTGGVKIGPEASYKTPNLGPFSLVAGGGLYAQAGKEGFGVGVGVGAGVCIDLGSAGGTKFDLTAGVAYTPLLGVPALGVVLQMSPDHKVKMQELLEAAQKAFGIDKTDENIAKAADDKLKVTAIFQNPYARYAIERANPGLYAPGAPNKPFGNMSDEKVLKEYQTFKKGLENGVRASYDPGHSLSIGLGIGPEGRFVFLIGSNIITSQEVKTAVYEGKSKDAMEQEVAIAHMKSLAERKNRGEELSKKDISEIETLSASRQLITIAGSKDLAVYIPNTNPPIAPPAKPIENSAQLEARFNEILKPLNMAVELVTVNGQKLFEIKFTNWDREHTNYDIAVDPKMKSGGVIFNGGHIYLASDFAKDHPPTILRSDYEYTHTKEGKDYHSIVTISDSPETAANDIYKSSPQILSSRGGKWYPDNGLGFDAYTNKPKPNNIMTFDQAKKTYNVDDIKLLSESKKGRPVDAPPVTDYINTLSITEAEKGTADEKVCTDFATEFFKTYKNQIEYRVKSTKESVNNQFADLNNDIVTGWTKQFGKAPNIAELNLVRLKLMDQSFSELGSAKTPAERQKAFETRLENTMGIIRMRFDARIKLNHSKYPEGDPRRIRMPLDDMMRKIHSRIKTIDVNSKEGIELSKIDRTSTIVATMKIIGFRGNIFGADNKDPDQKMIGASEDYATYLKDKPNSFEADMARMIFEENSTLPVHLDIKENTPGDTLLLVKEEIHDLLRADLTQKVISTLFNPMSRGLFSGEGRNEILRLAASKEKLTFNDKSAKALVELQNLVEGIRIAEMKGESYYTPKNAPDFRFALKIEARDGVYKKCTNYSMWLNEKIELQMRTDKIPPGLEIRAGYGVSTSTTSIQSVVEYSSLNIAAVVAVQIKSESVPPPTTETPSENPPASSGGSGQGAAPEKIAIPIDPAVPIVPPTPTTTGPTTTATPGVK